MKVEKMILVKVPCSVLLNLLSIAAVISKRIKEEVGEIIRNKCKIYSGNVIGRDQSKNCMQMEE